MGRILIVTLLVVLPIVLSTSPKDKRSPVSPPLYPASGVAATGAAGLNYGQQQAGSETHDKKNFGLNFSSDKGSSNTYSNTGLQAGAAGGFAQGQGYYPQYPGWGTPPVTPGGWGTPPVNPGWGTPPVTPGGWGTPPVTPGGWGVPPVNPGWGSVPVYPIVGSASGVQVPGVNAGSIAGARY